LLVVSGLEGCCDGTQKYQFQLSNADSWTDLTVQNLKAFSGTSVEAYDPDDGAYGRLEYSFATQSSLFNIEETEGQITTSAAAPLDYEDATSHTLRVVVTDGGGLQATSSILVNVIDVNEPPSFYASASSSAAIIHTATMKVNENSPPGLLIGQVYARDPDHTQILSYEFAHGFFHPSISIVQCDGTISVRPNNGAMLDYEETSSFTVNVVVVDDGAPLSRKAVLSLIITIVDVNESPVVYSGFMTVNENSLANTVVGTVNATDPDHQETLMFHVVSEFPSASATTATIFQMNNNEGNILVRADNTINYEVVEEYLVTVEVVDQGELSSTAVITITVLDINEPPSFASFVVTTTNIMENSPEGTPVGGPMLALDPDTKDFGTLTYSIVSNRLSTRMLPTHVNYTLAITTANFVGAGTKDDVDVRLFGDARIAGTTWTPLEVGDILDGTMTRTIVKTEYVGNVESIQFRISGNDGWMTSKVEIGRAGNLHTVIIDLMRFHIGTWSNPKLAVSQCLLMHNGQPRTTEPSFGSFSCPNGYRLPTTSEWNRVSSCVVDLVSDTVDIVTSVGGCNCRSSSSGDTNDRRYCKNPSAETMRLGRQCGDTAHYHVCVRSEITALSTSTSSFGIDRSTGQIYITDNTLDYESTNSDARTMQLRIRATDPTGAYGETNAIITLSNQNEAPTIRAQVGAFSVSEDSTFETVEPISGQRGVIGAQVIVEDADASDDYTSLMLEIVNGDPTGMFAIDDENHIQLKDSTSLLNYEFISYYNLTLRVTDVGGSWTESQYNIAIIDVNEVPSFDEETHIFTIAENVPLGTTFGSVVTGADPDAGTTLVHTIVIGEGHSEHYVIDKTTGQLSTARALDHEELPVHWVVVRLSDGALYVSANVTINVRNVNEAPSFTEASATYYVNISSESSAGQTVGAPLSVIDPDGLSDRPTFVFLPIAVTSSVSCFDLGRASGQIFFHSSSLVHDCLNGGRSHLLSAVATDSGGLSTAITKLINITIIQSNRSPLITIPLTPLTVLENSNTGTIVGTVKQVDPDGDTVQWFLSPESFAFAIHPTTGVLTTLASEIDYEKHQTYIVHVIAVEDATPSKLMDSKPITVFVQNVNESPTIVDNVNRTVNENSAIGTYVGPALHAIDPDMNDILTYVSVTLDAWLTLDTEDGQLTVLANIDYEERDLLSSIIRVSDASGLASAEAEIVVHVKDVNEPPNLSLYDTTGTSPPHVSVRENATAGTPLFTVTAVDHETIVDDLTYTVRDGSGNAESNNLFMVASHPTIVNAQQVLLASNALDYERAASYVIYVCVFDAESLNHCVDVEVKVLDVLDMTVESFVGATDHNTQGGEIVQIVGSNFGPVDGTLISSTLIVTYGSNSQFTAKDCGVVTGFNTVIECTTAPGAGGSLPWTVTITGVGAITSTLTTSYARPNITSVELTPDPMPTPGRTSLVVTGNNFGGSNSLISMTYGGEFGDLYTATACRHVESNVIIECQTAAGVNDQHNIVLTVNGLSSSVFVAGITYAAPSIDFMEGAINMSTTGGEIIYLMGTNFGAMTTPAAITDGTTFTPIVRYGTLSENTTSLSITDGINVADGTAVYVAKQCVVRIAHVQIMCTTEAGMGTGHQWEVTIGSQTSVLSTATTSYRPPVILSITGTGVEGGATTGGQEVLIQGIGFHPLAEISAQYGAGVDLNVPTYTATACTVIVDHFSIRCLTAPGTGRNLPWSIVVGSQRSTIHTASNCSYGTPIITSLEGDGASNADTNGGETVIIRGGNFGPLGTSVGATYGVVTQNNNAEEITMEEDNNREADFTAEYHAEACSVTGTGHNEITCTSVPGVGRPLFWTVQVDGQNSTVPTTSYARPSLINVTDQYGQPLENLKTEGNDIILLRGGNFGRVGSNMDIHSVTYGVDGTSYTAVDCTVLSNTPSSLESVMQCRTAPGVGTSLRFVIDVGGQKSILSSANDALTTLSYAAPTIIHIDPQFALTSNTKEVTITGTNFGPPGTLVGVSFGYSHATPYGEDAVQMTHMSHSTIRFHVPHGTVGSGHLVQVHVTDVSAAQLNVSRTSNTVLFNVSAARLDTVRASDARDLSSPIVLFGSSFGASNLTGYITIGTTVAGSTSNRIPIVQWDHSQIVCAPTSLEGDLTVYVGDQRSNTIVGFARSLLDMNPVVTTIIPNTGPTEGNINVVITGERLGSSVNPGTIHIGDHLCTPVLSFTAERIECVLPSGSGDAKVVVNNGWQRGETDINNQLVFFAYGTPEIRSVTPVTTLSTERGETITLEGYNFAPVPSDNILVLDNNINVEVLTATASRLTFIVPAGHGGATKMQLTVSSRTSEAAILLRPAPTISSINPTTVTTAGGEIMRIVGLNFGLNPSVKIGDRSCTSTTLSNSSEHHVLTCTMPQGGGERNMQVTITSDIGETSRGTLEGAVSYNAPTITAIDGALGNTKGGNLIELTGASFGYSANFSAKLVDDTTAAKSSSSSSSSSSRRRNLLQISSSSSSSHRTCVMMIQKANHTHATVIVPPCHGQSMSVQVVTPYQTGAPPTEYPKLSFDAPVLTYASPLPANADGDKIYIHGHNLGGVEHSVVVRLDGVPCLSSRWLPDDPEFQSTIIYANVSAKYFGQNYVHNNSSTYNNDPVLECLSATTTVGTRNISVDVAGVLNVNDTLLPNAPLVTLRCRVGYHGDINKECRPCPVGAICDGGLARPRSQHGWWSLNTTRFVRCLPSHACLGNNTVR